MKSKKLDFSTMPDPKDYCCRDIDLASALMSAGLELSSVESVKGEVLYIFAPQYNLVETLESYFRDELSISPRKTSENLRSLRELTNQVKDPDKEIIF